MATIPDSRPAEEQTTPRVTRGLLLTVLSLTLAAYARTLGFEFVYDDFGSIVENPALHSWHSVPQYFTQQVWYGFRPDWQLNYYRPVFLLWLRLNYFVFGLHPWGWHLTTVLAHVLATLLVFCLARRLLRDALGAIYAALIFGLHPVHVEVVSWVSGVTESLVAVGVLGSFLAFLRWREERRRLWLAVSLLCFAAGLLEKETALVLPVLVWGYEWIQGGEWPPERAARAILSRAWPAMRPAVPYLILVLLYIPARYHALQSLVPLVTPTSLSTVVLTWPALIWFWIRHLFLPVGLSSAYDFASVEHPGWTNFVLPGLLVLAVALLALMAAWCSRAAAFALLWMMVFLVPVLDIRLFEASLFAQDRYLYLPSVGFAILIAMAIRHGRTQMHPLGRLPLGQVSVMGALAAFMAVGVVLECGYFRNNWTFFEHCARRAPNNELAVTNYATALAERGRLEEAVGLLQQVVQRDPKAWYAFYDLGLTYYRTGRLEDAQKNFERAIQINPYVGSEHLYLGLVLLKMHRPQEAEAEVRRALVFSPQGYGFHFALGVILRSRGDQAGAAVEFRKELAAHPEEAAAQQQLLEVERELAPPSTGHPSGQIRPAPP